MAKSFKAGREGPGSCKQLKQFWKRHRLPLLALSFSAVAAAWLIGSASAGCSGQTPVSTSGPPQTATAATPPHQRLQVGYFKGIYEPRAESWQDLLADAGRLRADNINSVTISPPVLISQRAGKRPRIILEGEAAAAADATAAAHRAGFAVHLSLTTSSPDLSPRVDPIGPVLNQLSEDTLRWAESAEEEKVEIFTPLNDYNLVLGTEAAAAWSESIVPRIREKYNGLLAAKVVPDTDEPPPPGMPYGFEQLNYRGYDYLMLDILPQGTTFDQDAFNKYAGEVLKRAALVAQRDGLKGIMIGEFGGWREPAGAGKVEGPVLGAEGQATMAEQFLNLAKPQTAGAFYLGWTLPGRGAKGFPVEEALKKGFGS